MATPVEHTESPLTSNQVLPKENTDGALTRWTLTDMRAEGLSKTVLFPPKYCYKIIVDGKEEHKSKRVGPSGDNVVWNEFHTFSLRPSSTVDLQLCMRPDPFHKQDKLVGVATLNAAKLDDGAVSAPLSLQGKVSLQRLTFRLEMRSGDEAVSRRLVDSVVQNTKDTVAKTNLHTDEPDTSRSVSEDDMWKNLRGSLGSLANIVTAFTEIHPFAILAWRTISVAYELYKKHKERDAKIIDLLATMQRVYDIVVNAADIARHRNVLERLSIQTVDAGYFISEYCRSRKRWIEVLKMQVSDITGKLDAYQKKFEDLRSELIGQVNIETEISVLRIVDRVEDLNINAELQDIHYSVGARDQAGSKCLADTRTKVLDEITEWASDTAEGSSRLLFLNGQAGTGKSTVARTIASRFMKLGRLGSAFCFSRDYALHRQPQHLFSTLALDLADFDPAFRKALWKSVGQSRAKRTTTSISEQFENFLLGPCKDLAFSGPILIITDALDESGDVAARASLVQTLFGQSHKLPPNIRILITARPEMDIMNVSRRYRSFGAAVKSMQEYDSSPDVLQYIRFRLLSELPLDGIDDDCVRTLADMSEGLFQWAAVTCSYVIGIHGKFAEQPKERYEIIVASQEGRLPDGTARRPLDSLYTAVLAQVVSDDSFNDIAIHRFRQVMGLLLYVAEPLTMAAFEGLGEHVDGLGSRPKTVARDVLSRLGAFIGGVADDATALRPHHSSFRDFLTQESRGARFYVGDAITHHTNLLRSCFGVLKAELRFNICCLKTSYMLNKDIPDLGERVNKHVFSHVSYAARQWAQHLERAGRDCVIKSNREILDLLNVRFLFWLEVLSLLGAMNAAAWSLSTLLTCTREVNETILAHMAGDALQFVRNLATALAGSAPHVYMSAMMNASHMSPVWEHYAVNYPGMAKARIRNQQDWPRSTHIIRGHTDLVESVAFSPDGRRIVSGSYDYTIRVWDAETGDCVTGPLEGHSAWVTSVAISPDGRRIVSGSVDRTIRIWDAETGECVTRPLEGHTGWVTSVAFSPDGRRIVSGSWDKTIRVWDAETGECVGGPLEGHEDGVKSVAVSPDGRRIVSGSWDKTIRVWDVETGECVGLPLEGHVGSVYSVAFSPDGRRIVSGSDDETIRVWDAETGECVGGPLEGHEDVVNSVAISPDGRRIVSGSWDKTIRVWDAETGECVGGPLKGHEDPVHSVAFSLDGRRIVSGSVDSTIRVWDAETGECVTRPLEGHTGWVTSVAFSPDGRRIVSGSVDGTIGVWDAETGDCVGGPLEGHENLVASVAFSPDGRRIVSGSYDTTIRIWDVDTGECVGGPLEGHKHSVNSVAFSPDGRRIVSGSVDRTIRVWDVETGECVTRPLEGHTGWVTSAAFSPDGRRIVSGSWDKTIRVWDAETGDYVGGPLEGDTGRVTSVAISPDGRRIVSGSDDKTIRVWDAETGECVGGPLKGHEGGVWCVAISPDGRRIVSGSVDRTICIWDAETGECVTRPLEGHTGWVTSVAFSPDGRRIVSGSWDKTIRVWDTDAIEPVRSPWHLSFSTNARHRSHQAYISPRDEGTRIHLDPDTGWVMADGNLLLWIHPDQLAYLWTPGSGCRFVLPRSRMIELDLSEFTHGERWQECYHPEGEQSTTR